MGYPVLNRGLPSPTIISGKKFIKPGKRIGQADTENAMSDELSFFFLSDHDMISCICLPTSRN
jgi:hypothetical protein